MLKAIILERIDKTGVNILKTFSNVTQFYDKSRTEILKKVNDYEIIIIKSTISIDRIFLKNSTKLRVIGRAGTGLDNIDLQETKKRNIKVFSVPKGNTIATSEYVIAMILILTKNVFLIDNMIKKNDFRRHTIDLKQLSSMSVGIIGIGNLGIEISKRLEPFKCKIYGYDPFTKMKDQFKQLRGIFFNRIEKFLEKSDILVLAANLNPSSEYLINKDNILKFKKGSYFINCSRARLVDENALLYGLNKKIVKSAAIDLIDPEPIYTNKKKINNSLINHPNVFYSPHVAALTKESQERIAKDLSIKIKKFFKRIGTAK